MSDAHITGSAALDRAIEAAFRAGFKAGFGASEDGFNGKNPLQEAWTDSDYDRRYKDHVERRVQEAEDAAFKAAYPDSDGPFRPAMESTIQGIMRPSASTVKFSCGHERALTAQEIESKIIQPCQDQHD